MRMKQTDVVDVAIIGGGLSGLAAAVSLAVKGVRVALFERSPKLGGRCYSYIDEKTGDVVDNGQHVLLGAYHNTIRYLDLIGSRKFLRERPSLSLPLHHPEKGFGTFNVVSLPRPFHLTAGMLKFKLLSFNDRKKLLNVGFALRGWNMELERKLSSLSIEQWLNELHQSEGAKQCVWYPLAISVMNELPQTASALLFARSLKLAFLGKKSDSAVLIPGVGQTALYVDGAVRLLEKHKAMIHTSTEIDSLIIQHSRAGGIKTTSGDTIAAKHVISAVPYFALENLIPSEYRTMKSFTGLNQFASSPIVSIHLWFDKEFMEQEYVGLIGKTLQWVFDRRKIMNEEGKPHSYITAVISGAYETVGLSKDALVETALKDLHLVFPKSKTATLLHSIVIKEKRASFSPTNEVESFRPSSETEIQNLYLAGDWTNTGLPATIEGAIMSGFMAAKLSSR